MTEPAIWSSRTLKLAINAGNLGEIVKLVRCAHGWTQAELGERCSYSPSMISRLERGEQPLTDIVQIRRLADALRIPPSVLGLAPEAEPAPTARGPTVPRPRSDSSTAHVPAQLPTDIEGFIGRSPEIHQLDALISPVRKHPTAVVISAVSGTAGVGKTALAVHWAHRIADRFQDGQLYVNLRGFDPSATPVEPPEAVRGFLDALGVDPQRIPVDLGAQAALYRSLVAGKRILVLLDNARDTDQIRDLLPGTPGCLVVATSRNTLTGLITKQGATAISLDLLTSAESAQLLEYRIGRQRTAAEPNAIGEIVEACAGLPMALALAAARAVTHPRFTLTSLADGIRDSRDRLDALQGEGPDVDMRAVLSWSYDKLSDQAQRLFRMLGLHPGPDASECAIASLAGLPCAQARKQLAELCRAHLVTEQLPGRFGFHDLLRSYAKELIRDRDTEAERTAAIRRMLEHYVHSAYAADRLIRPVRTPIVVETPMFGVVPERPTGSRVAMDWFITECRVLLGVREAADQARFDAYTWKLAWALDTFLDRQGHWHDHADAWRDALAATQRLGDRAGQAQAHRILARAETLLGEYSDAHANLRHSIDILDELGDPIGKAHSYGDLSRLFERQDRLAEALDCSRRALELFKAESDLAGQANALNDVGWVQARSGYYQDALDSCGRAVEVHRGLGNSEGEAHAWDSLGYVHHHLDQYDQAIACYLRALGLFVELGDRLSHAATLDNLGDSQWESGDPAGAEESWELALVIYEQLDHPDAESLRTRLSAIAGAGEPPLSEETPGGQDASA